MLKQWTSITCANCSRVIGYDDDSYKELSALKCPHCKRWFYMSDARVEVKLTPIKKLYDVEQHDI